MQFCLLQMLLTCIPKWHENPRDSILITVPIVIALVELKKCAIMEIIALLSIGVNVLLLI